MSSLLQVVVHKRAASCELQTWCKFDYLTKAQPSCVEFEVAQQAEISNVDLDYAVLTVQSQGCRDGGGKLPRAPRLWGPLEI